MYHQTGNMRDLHNDSSPKKILYSGIAKINSNTHNAPNIKKVNFPMLIIKNLKLFTSTKNHKSLQLNLPISVKFQ